MQYDLTGKTAVVTGGSRGIGRFIADALHDAGATVLITARHEDQLEQTAAAIGPRCRAVACDHRRPEDIVRLADLVNDELGGADILVNNAGCMRGATILDLTLEMWNEVIDTNLTGVFLTTKALLPAMIQKNRGDIFMISSMSGKKGDPGAAAYAASKFGLQGFSQALMYEVRQHNIRVMVLNPSSVDKSPDTGGQPEKKYGKGLHLHAADIASTIVHLACLPGRTMIRDMDIYGNNP